RRKRLRERERKERNAWEESTDVRRRVCARAGAGGSLSCRSSLGYPLCASICCPNRYIFGSGLGFYRRERTVYGGFQTAVSSLSLDSCSVGVSLVGGREKRPYQVGDVRRGCYSGVCSNGGGDDLAPAIDLAGKDLSRVQDGGHGIRFVTVRHVPIVAGKKRPFSGVSAYGGGDVCGFASRGRANRASGVWVRGFAWA
ncbi:LOW QUALITY PROTEIN: hypothetical protein HID58_020122, partial [Brassica napus]